MSFPTSLSCLFLASAAAFSPVLADESFVPQIGVQAVQEAIRHASSEMLAMPVALGSVAHVEPTGTVTGNVAQVVQIGTANSALLTQAGMGNLAVVMQHGANNSAIVNQTSRGR